MFSYFHFQKYENICLHLLFPVFDYFHFFLQVDQLLLVICTERF